MKGKAGTSSERGAVVNGNWYKWKIYEKDPDPCTRPSYLSGTSLGVLGMTTETPSFRTPVTYSDVLFGEWQQEKMRHFMENTHFPVSIAVMAVYLLMVYYLPKIMETRKAFDLRPLLTLWNMSLSLYSAISFYYLFPLVWQSLQRMGMLGTLCYNDDLYTHPVSGYTIWLFIMSKGPELVDTLFLILRKRPVIFMHWYHHSVTFFIGQIYFTELVPWARWGVVINLAVHTVMYFYYGLRASGMKTPRIISKLITTMQITQFISGFYFAGVVFKAWLYNEAPDCQAKVQKMGLGLFVVFTYLYLFCQYFYKAYIKNDSPTRPPKTGEKSVEQKKED